MTFVLKPDREALAPLAALLGAALLALAAPGLLVPERAAAPFRRFARSVWPGRVLAAVCLAWSLLWVAAMPLGSLLDPLFPYLQFLLPVAVVAVCVFLPELLSCRAAGALMVLLPAPVLSAAQWHPSPWRLLAVAAAYAMAVAGMFVVAKPWLLRDAVAWTTSSPRRFRAVSAVFALAALALLAAAATVYPLGEGALPDGA